MLVTPRSTGLERVKQRETVRVYGILTSIDIILDGLRQGALDRLVEGLVLEHGADVSRAAGIHGTLERIVLPAKDVVAVLRIAVPEKYD
jgi:hypothetical protein